MLDITPCMYIVNEEYWIGYILRELCKVFPRVIVADTGSTDDTVAICKSFPQVALGEFKPHRPGYIGEAAQWAIDQVSSEWALAVNGDEYLEEAELLKLKGCTIEDGKKVGWFTNFILDFADGQFYIRGKGTYNRVVRAGTRYLAFPHPWETIDSCTDLEDPEVQKFWASIPIQGYHMRHLSRSSRDEDAYYRLKKLHFWEKTEWTPLSKNPFVPIEHWKNPYLEAMRDVVTA